jgi:polygalacturonase
MVNIKITFLSVLFSIIIIQLNGQIKIEKIKVDAPFRMPVMTIPDFSKCPEFSIVDYGAIQGDKAANSQAIAATVEAAHKAGGGTVVIPDGEWITGKIHLKGNVNLHLSKNAVLLFSDDPIDFLPAVPVSWEGLECMNYSPLIYAYACENIAITGEGKIKAKIDQWRKWFSRPSGHMNSLKRLYDLAYKNVPTSERILVNDSANLRPHLIHFNRCENIRLEGFCIQNSPFWTIHTYLCKNVLLRKLNVFAHGHNNDGYDPEMTQNVLVENCVFDQGDDAIAVKSGRDHEAWRLATPSKNIVIRNCEVKNGHQLLAIGSELSGGIENIYMQNCSVVPDAKMFHLVFVKTNERRGGFVKNIIVENVNAGNMSEGILGIETDVLYQWRNLMPTYDKVLTPISDIKLKNISAGKVKFVSRILGNKEMPIKNVSLKNVRAESVTEQKYIHENVNFKLPKDASRNQITEKPTEPNFPM